MSGLLYCQRDYSFNKVYDWSTHQHLWDLVLLEDGGYALGHSIGHKLFITKLDFNGDSLWSFQVGNYMDYAGLKITQSSNSNLFIASTKDSNAIVLQLTNNGDSVSSFRHVNHDYENCFNIISQLNNGNLIVSEIVWVLDYYPINYLWNYSQSGEVNWVQNFDVFHIPSLINLTDSNFLFLSHNYDFYKPIFLEKQNSFGDTVFKNRIDEGYGRKVIESKDLKYYSLMTEPYFDTFSIVKTNSYGQIEWKKKPICSGVNELYALCEIDSLLFAVGGECSNQDMIIHFFDNNGDSISQYRNYNYKNSWIEELVSDGSYLTIGAIVKDSVYNKSINIFSLSIDSLITSNIINHDQGSSLEFQISPNPCKNSIQIRSSNQNFELKRIELIDSRGRVVDNITFTSSHWIEKIDVSALKSGIYFVRINGSNSQIRKLIKN